MNKKVLVAIGVMAVAVALFASGAFAGPRLLGTGAAAFTAGRGPGGAGGPMANLTEAERAKVQSMSDAERQAFFQEKFGAGMPGDTAGGRPGRGPQVIEGEITESTPDQLTIKTSAGGSQAVYYDADTVIAIAKGSSVTGPATGTKVTAVVSPETDNVLAASILVLK